MNAEDIRDIKPVLYFLSNYRPLIITLAILLVSGLLYLLGRLIKKRLSARSNTLEPPKTPEQIAYDALAALAAKNLPAKGKIKEYYYELSDIVRRYIEDKLEIRAPEMTTEEFLFSLRFSAFLSQAHKDLLKEFLTLCDVVKFAKYGPTLLEVEQSFLAAKRFVDETKQLREEKEYSLKK
ncbi:MAG: hypothetical protein V1727_02910 [Candidatus Omnitrophota bacterium]